MYILAFFASNVVRWEEGISRTQGMTLTPSLLVAAGKELWHSGAVCRFVVG